MADNTAEDIVVKLAIAYGGYLLIAKPLLAYIGASPEEAAAIQNIDNTAPAANPFSFQYAPLQKYFNNWRLQSTPDQFMHDLKLAYDNGEFSDYYTFTSGTIDGDIAVAAESIYNAFGFFKFIADFDAVLGVFNTVNSKAQVAAIDAYLRYNYGRDLWTFLKDGALGSFRGLKPGQLSDIANRVNSLPDINFN